MLKNLHRETYSAGSIIFKEGDPGSNAYIVEEGYVEVSVSSTLQARIGKGEMFGEIALIDHGPRTATVRAIENTTVHTLWMDPVLNDRAYILPGLGDAGDRINGRDGETRSRDMLQLIADYGANIADLYRSQIRTIEETVLRR